MLLMYSFFAILCVKIYLSTGVIAYFKKIYTEGALKALSQILVNLFLPIYGVIEVSRMASPTNLKIFWILVLSVLVSMLIAYYIGKIFQYLLKMDVRIENSYSLLCCVPSIGTLPLVVAKAFCYPGGPLESDPQCPNILGYMMVNYLVFQISLFIIGFNLIAKDANFGYEIDDKMGLTWHIIVEKLFKKDYWVLLTFRKYFKKSKLANEKFEEFQKNNKLIRNEGEITYKYINLDQVENNKLIGVENDYEKANVNKEYLENFVNREKGNLEPALAKDTIKKNSQKNVQGVHNLKLEQIIQEDDLRNEDNNEEHHGLTSRNNKDKEKQYFDSRAFSQQGNSFGQSDSNFDNKKEEEIKLENIQIKDSGKENLDQVSNNPVIKKILPLTIEAAYAHQDYQTKNNRQVSDLYSNVKKNFQSDRFDLQFKQQQRLLQRQTSIQISISQNKPMYMAKSFQVKNFHEEIQEFLLDKKGPTILRPFFDSEHDVYIPKENLGNLATTKKERALKRKRIDSLILQNKQILSMRLNRHKSILGNSIGQYYQKVFNIVEENLDESMHEQFLLEKSEIMKNIHDIPPKFPIAKGIEVNRNNLKDIQEIWKDYLSSIKKLNEDFELNANFMSADFCLILNKMFSPVVVGTILGLVVGIAGMRDVLFSTNHYISNLVEGIYIITRSTVPLLYITVGVSFVTIRGFNLNLSVTWTHLLLGILIRYAIMPGIGLLWTYIWTEYYGGIIKESKVFRISLFIPFCVPSSANLVIITNILRYFVAESNILLVGQNITNLVTITILYLIYFVVIGYQ